MIDNNVLDKIQEIIEKYNLKTKCRKQEYIYKRYFIFYYLRKIGYSYSKIGRIFEKDHATILHGVKMHKLYNKLRDKVYMENIVDVKNELGDVKYIPNLRKDVMRCDTVEKLEKIKRRIQENYY